MRGARGTADRFRDLIERHLLPGLVDMGFGDRLPGSLAVAEAHGVVWVLDLDLAPWSRPSRVAFTVAWGVDVPGLDDVLGDPSPDVPTIATCAVTGRLGVRGGVLEPRWFSLRQLPPVVAAMADAQEAKHVLAAIYADVLPELRHLANPVDVQRHLHDQLVTGRGAPDDNELRTIRRIAALSLLLGDRANAARWLDHLEARSTASMAPDLVAARLAPLRGRLVS